MKKQNIYKGFLDYQSEFDHRWACWANNHNGWAKMKKLNKRIAKKRLRRVSDEEANCGCACDNDVAVTIILCNKTDKRNH